MIAQALISALETSQPLSKDVHSYLPFHYKGYKYPLLAKNHMENRDVAALERLYDPRWLSSGVSYRPLRPRYLCFLRTNGFGFDVRPVRADQDVSYVFIAYTTEHFNCAPGRGNVASADLKTLSALALMVTRQCKKKAEERKERAPDAFWLAHLCTPHDRFADDDGNETMIDQTNEHLVQKLKNEDVRVALSLPLFRCGISLPDGRGRHIASATSSAWPSGSSSWPEIPVLALMPTA